jgi:hypothetical protein
VEKKEKDNYIQFSVFSDYNYLDIYKIIKLIVRGRGAVRRINDNLYLIDFKK